MKTSTRTYDAVIVGARCAGAATALLLARRGLRVLAIDRAAYGTDTLSTHALMRGGVLQLKRWGLIERLEATGTPAVRSTVFHYGDEVIDLAIKPRDGVEALYAPRRTVLDRLLVDASREAGAKIRHGTRLVDLVRDAGGRVVGVTIRNADGSTESLRAGIVIGADGRRSAFARQVGARRYRAGVNSTGVVYGYWRGLELEGYHWYYRPGVSSGAIATGGGHCVFAAVPAGRYGATFGRDAGAGYRQVLGQCDPRLADAVGGAEQVGRFFAFPGSPGHIRQSWGPGWALVGDAAYFKDPLTAHGITDAFRDAELLANAVAEGSSDALVRYQSMRDRLSTGLFDVTEAVASFDWDMDRIKDLHIQLSREMNREVAAMAGLDDDLPLSA